LRLSQPAAPGVRLMRPSDPAWAETVARARSSIFHTAGYHQYTAGFGRGTPFLAVVGDEEAGVAWPYLLRTVGSSRLPSGSQVMDVGSVYGYPGPLVWGWAMDGPKLGEALALVAETWRLQGAVSVFTRFNPLLDNAAAMPASPAWATPGSPGVVRSGMTVSVDLTLDIDEIRGHYSRGLAREIRRGREAGLITTDDTEWTALPEFSEQYRETMERLQATGFYYFTQVDFVRLHRCLPEAAHLLVTRLGDRLAAAGLFLESGDHLEWHLVSSSNELIELSPSKVLVEDAIEWAQQRGFAAMHLGGGRGAQADSLYFFKGRFSPRRHQFAVGSWVLDGDRYADLVTRHLERLPTGATIDPSFFPAYRAWPKVSPPVGPT
ncbi:MAG TPA: GNAT family N-acetyltransferase, partial [Candidatus Limnocylindrales bacterium]